jgi:hypothetical protein
MSENPDNGDYIGLGPQGKMEGTEMDSRFLIPNQGMLRFVYRDEGKARPSMILQQYQWSAKDGGHNWYDLPLVVE